jgi:hypothetical protein
MIPLPHKQSVSPLLFTNLQKHISAVAAASGDAPSYHRGVVFVAALPSVKYLITIQLMLWWPGRLHKLTQAITDFKPVREVLACVHA